MMSDAFMVALPSLRGLRCGADRTRPGLAGLCFTLPLKPLGARPRRIAIRGAARCTRWYREGDWATGEALRADEGGNLGFVTLCRHDSLRRDAPIGDIAIIAVWQKRRNPVCP
jgi:hypothetical protein